MLTQYQSVTLEDCQRQAFAIYKTTALPRADPIPAPPFALDDLDPASDDAHKALFYKRVNCNVVATIIKNGLSETGYADLLLQKEKFEYMNHATGEVEFHGPTMLLLIWEKIDPSTIVGLDLILTKLKTIKLGDHGNNVDTMLTFMESQHKILTENGRTSHDYRKLLLNALRTGPNHKFNEYVERIVDDVEAGFGSNSKVTADQLVVACRSKFNNMDDKNEWNLVNPRDAKLLALQTRLEDISSEHKKQMVALATGFQAQQNNVNGKGNNGNSDRALVWKEKRTNDEYVQGILRERTINTGPTKMIDGELLHWCPNHVHPNGAWNGLYVKHRADQHEEYVQQRRGKRGKPKTAAAGTSTGATNSNTQPPVGTQKLQLDSKLKDVLCTNLCMSSEDIDKLVEQASGN